jgi:hypothetical protein
MTDPTPQIVDAVLRELWSNFPPPFEVYLCWPVVEAIYRAYANAHNAAHPTRRISWRHLSRPQQAAAVKEWWERRY